MRLKELRKSRGISQLKLAMDLNEELDNALVVAGRAEAPAAEGK